MEYFLNNEGSGIVHDLINTIHANKDYLSEIDGAIGDGDHGINMNKGFMLCRERLTNNNADLSKALKILGRVLLMEIGGSMGPLYGTFFMEMAKVCEGREQIDKQLFGEMLKAALSGIGSLGNAKAGDKTLMDTLVPAVEAYETEAARGKSFAAALAAMKEAAEKGRDSTRDMVARVGRASRLGERSKGVIDAGAASCNLILQSMANSIISLVK